MKKQLLYILSLFFFLFINQGVFYVAEHTSLTKTYKCTINKMPTIGAKTKNHCQKFLKSEWNIRLTIGWTKYSVMACSILLYGFYALKLHKYNLKTKKILGGALYS